MQKKEFREKIMLPLSQAFHCPIYFSGKESYQEGLTLTPDVNGFTFTDFKDTPIVIRWYKDHIKTLSILCHELGHAALHKYGVGSTVGLYLGEMEAEMVSRLLFNKLSIPYPLWSIDYPEIRYFEYMEEKYHAICRSRRCKPKKMRMDRIEKVVDDLYHTLKDISLD